MNRREFLRTGAVLGVSGLGGVAAVPAYGLPPQGDPSPAPSPAAPLRLDSNENPLGLAPSAHEAVLGAVAEANRYPDAIRGQLEEALAAKNGVGRENVVLGNGSTEILQMVIQASASPTSTLVLADPTFEAVSRYQRPFSYRIERVPLDDHHGHDLGSMRKATAGSGPTVVYVCNPNNPTGTLTSSADLDAWIVEAPETTLFLVDEAYFEYVRAPGYWSALRWIGDHPNVVVARTFSKIYGMAGLRLGYALAHPHTAARLREFMSSDNANLLALAAGLASLEDDHLIDRSRASNERAKKVVLGCLDELGLSYLPSHTNFLMHRISGDLGTYRRRMRDRGIRVGRPFPPFTSYNRLSLGRPEEMERVAEALRDFRKQGWL